MSWAFPLERVTQNVFSISNRVWVQCQLQAVPLSPGCAARCWRGRKQQAQRDALLDSPLARGWLALRSRRVSASCSVPANRCSCRIYGVPRDRCASFALYPPVLPCTARYPLCRVSAPSPSGTQALVQVSNPPSCSRPASCTSCPH